MKKNILILAALIAVVLAVPFLIIKADEAIQIKNAEFKEKQNNVCYEKAGECMDAGEYDEAIELLEKLPGNYEDAEYIIRYAKFCKAVQNEEGIEELHKLIWNFPKEDKYSGKYAEEMKRVNNLGAKIVGINNRNLKTFEEDLHTTERLTAGLENRSEKAVVSESGIKDNTDLRYLETLGIDAVLIGESFMRRQDIAGAVNSMRGL